MRHGQRRGILGNYTKPMPKTQATNLQLRQRVARRLRHGRLAKKLSQEQLAEALGVSTESVSRYECGKLAISLELLSRASRVLGLPLEQLVGGGPTGLSMAEAELVEGWRHLGTRGQQALLELVRCWSEAQEGGRKMGEGSPRRPRKRLVQPARSGRTAT